jgi:hypothetical protein
VALATGYRFRVLDNATGLQVGSDVNTINNSFSLKQVSGIKNKVYRVLVAPIYNGVANLEGLTGCLVTTSPSATGRMSDEPLATVFTAKAYPNPFAEYFNLAIESSSDDQVEIKVYDMIGRELEARKATVSELSTQEIGINYPSGVYNIIVSQGNQVKTLRMIKR